MNLIYAKLKVVEIDLYNRKYIQALMYYIVFFIYLTSIMIFNILKIIKM